MMTNDETAGEFVERVKDAGILTAYGYTFKYMGSYQIDPESTTGIYTGRPATWKVPNE